MNCSHNAWLSSNGTFRQWRSLLAQAAGLPPLDFMESYYVPLSKAGTLAVPTLYVDDPDRAQEHLAWLDRQLPIRWESLKPDPLLVLLAHSDCEGDIAPELCVPIAVRLIELMLLLPTGQFHHWHMLTQQFIDGLMRAADAGEPLAFR